MIFALFFFPSKETEMRIQCLQRSIIHAVLHAGVCVAMSRCYMSVAELCLKASFIILLILITLTNYVQGVKIAPVKLHIYNKVNFV